MQIKEQLIKFELFEFLFGNYPLISKKSNLTFVNRDFKDANVLCYYNFDFLNTFLQFLCDQAYRNIDIQHSEKSQNNFWELET